jgi:hypothetical protein
MANQTFPALLLLTCTSGALLSSGCAWSRFDDLEDKAPVRAYEAPANYRRTGYGSVLASFHGSVRGKDVSRFMASAGADSPIVMERAWNGSAIKESGTLRCKSKKDCEKGVGAGAVLVPFETWAPGTDSEHHGCVYTPGFPNAYVFCETNGGQNPTFKLSLPEERKPTGATLRFAGAPLPKDHPLGIALVGVHADEADKKAPTLGGLYAQQNSTGDAPKLLALALTDPSTGEPFSAPERAGDFGFSLAAAENAQGELVIAIGQPAQNRVIVATYDARIEVDPELEDAGARLSAQLRTRACLTSEEPELTGVGKRLTMGDVNGDGEPEIFVGIDPLDATNGDEQRVWLYPGAGLPAFEAGAAVCPGWGEAPVRVDCEDGVRGIDCAATGFGAALALGDVNGDGFGDLLVGAPRADVQGVNEAGVVWIIPGSDGNDESGGLDLASMTNLYASSFESKAHAGTAVAALRTKDRDEPVVGAPGADTVYVFMCSKLEGELSPKNLCLPK